MRRLGDTVARLAAAGTRQTGATAEGRLRPFASGGANPGGLDALIFTPSSPAGGALVVVLHGCSQTAEAYDHGAGWSRHAEVEGFSVLYPQQRRANNPGLCFNWFSPDDTVRERGEAASIAAMIIAMIRDHDLDPGRVFVTGLSAGGAMSAVLLAVYPELFAGGAVIAGLPYGAATSMPQAFEAMRGHGASPGPDRVLRAAPATRRWPRIAIVHGTADHTVHVANADRLVAQWLGVHGMAPDPGRESRIGRCRLRTWADASGEVRVEDYRIDGMGHGTPLDTQTDPLESAGSFMLDVGFASTVELIKTWGLDDEVPTARRQTAKPPSARATGQASAALVLTPANEIQAVIESALRRARLML